MKKVICASPYCTNNVIIRYGDDNAFCNKCREEHSLRVLKIQVEHQKSIQDLIIEAKLFKTASGMGDYVGVSFVTIYNWLERYFNMTFQEFKRKYICKSPRCYLLNIKRSSYSRNDYILRKIKEKTNYCACLNSLEKDYIMTNCPQEALSTILRNYPRIVKISDQVFSLMPKPIHIITVRPIHVL